VLVKLTQVCLNCCYLNIFLCEEKFDSAYGVAQTTYLVIS